MISRQWKGIATRGQAERYIAHLREDTFPKLAAIRGFAGASILRRESDRGTEFQIVTLWESLEAIRSFAGPDVEVAVVPPAARALLLDHESRATHYEIVETFMPRQAEALPSS
jgi:heme-degrading monooxygenase HmoA